MHILVLSDNFPPERNAAAARVFERARYWVRWGHRVTVVTSFPNFPEGKVFEGYRNDWYGIEDMDGIRVVRVKTFIAPNVGLARRVLDFLSYMVTGAIGGVAQERPDVVLATSPQFFAAVAGDVVARLRNVPFVFEIADLWPASVTAVGAMKRGLPIRLAEHLELALYREAKEIVALTPAFKTELAARGVPAEKINVVLNGAELGTWTRRPRDHALAESLGMAGKFVIGYIGTLGMAHGLASVLDAARLLIDDDRIRFLFVGPGAERDELIGQRDRLALRNVVFVGGQPRDKVAAYWSLCDVALIHLKDSPVFATVIPSKIFEAMSMGLPLLLAAPEGEASKIVRGDEAGLVVAPQRPEELAAAVLRLADEPALLARLGEQSHAAASKYSRERQARSVLDVLLRCGR